MHNQSTTTQRINSTLFEYQNFALGYQEHVNMH